MTNEEIDKLIEETYADSGLGRWFKEKWVDISRKKGGKHPPCGRSKATDSSYPKCRPSKKVSNKTPKTTKSMSTKDKKKAVNIKRRAEAPVSTTGAGRSPVMTKLKEEKYAEKELLPQDLREHYERVLKEFHAPEIQKEEYVIQEQVEEKENLEESAFFDRMQILAGIKK